MTSTSAESPLRPEMSYQDWIDAYHPSPQSAAELRRTVRALPRHPLVSILLPVYNPEIKHLAAAIDSVKAQIYPHWQLCVADDASTDPKIRPFLAQAAASESRITKISREENGHIAAATNSALGLANGEWCALLDQDDLLSTDALAFVACEINAHPDAGLIYSDEDKVDDAQMRSDPYFKPDWNPELFLAQNYLNHLGVYRTDLVRELDGLREGFAGSQDYDLAWRCVENLTPKQVRHIPRILYHWRAIPGSLAASIDAKPASREGARNALKEHLERCGIAAQVAASPENPARHRVTYDLPARPPLVSFIIPTRDRADLLQRCLQGIRETDYEKIEVVVVDNGSTDPVALGLLEELSREKDARVIEERGPFNFSRLINRGAATARGEALVILNNDIEIEDHGWLREMISQLLQPNVGAIGARLWYPNQTLQHGGVILGLGGMAGHAFEGAVRSHPGYFDQLFSARDCSAVTGACLAVRRDIFSEVGGFDEKDFAVSFNDIDFCLRLRERGLRIVWTPHTDLIHHESASRGRARSAEADAQFYREAAALREKWGQRLLRDPFYNLNFSLNAPGYEIAFPPRAEAATVPV